MDGLGATQPERILDVLAERLAFEREMLAFYDRIVAIMRRTVHPPIRRLLESMQAHRNQERAHARWLEGQIERLGGDPAAQTELSRLAGAELAGIAQVLMQAGDLRLLFHALLAAELLDAAGWQLLVKLAEEAGDRKARRELRRRFHEEQEHLGFMRRALEQISIRRIFGPPPGSAPF